MIAGLMKICKVAEYMKVTPERARLLLANMGVKPICEKPTVWRKLDIDTALGLTAACSPAATQLEMPIFPEAPKSPVKMKLQVCKSVWVAPEYHAQVKSFAEGMGMEVRDLAAQLLVEMVQKKTNGGICTATPVHNGSAF